MNEVDDHYLDENLIHSHIGADSQPLINFNYPAMRVLQEEHLFEIIDKLKISKEDRQTLQKEIALLQKLAFLSSSK